MKMKNRFSYFILYFPLFGHLQYCTKVQSSLLKFEPSNFLQDFDDWDDVGLNIPQPPNLLRLYRDYDKHAMPLAASALAKTEEENEKLVGE